ncbi:YraN family protein [Oscillibacter sp.]|uniref:YraN family protein n=1 Tax=Oscillibacter sp. TaxID=1945593 RepID=UPI0028ADA7F6|nr:YraN family protein [Oscillibacter sp.]
MTTRSAGNRGEAEVAGYLRRRGYGLIASQWRCRFGEIDLIARDPEGLLCFVEVKLRSNLQVGLPREYVTVAKQARLRSAAALYMSVKDLDEPARFDVAEVYDENGALRVEYLENAFE